MPNFISEDQLGDFGDTILNYCETKASHGYCI